MKKKILIISQSKILNEYLKDKLFEFNFDVYISKDGFNGLIKMRNEHPDLVIIDYYISKISINDFLREKRDFKSTQQIPLIILYSKRDRINKDMIINMAKNKVVKIIEKPLEVETLFNAIGDIFNIKMIFDNKPCYIDLHINSDILFIDISKGLNNEKIDFLKYKIKEIKELYNIKIKKVLLIFSNLKKQSDINELLIMLLQNILNNTEALITGIHVLSRDNNIKIFLAENQKYKFIEVSESFEKALEYFGLIEINDYEDEINKKIEEIITKPTIHKVHESSFKIKYSEENEKLDKNNSNFNIAIIDNDLSVLEYLDSILTKNNLNSSVFENGKEFLVDLKRKKYDLIFMDLLMPEINGFQILAYLQSNKINIPVIIYTNLSDKKYIFHATRYGVECYLIKPVEPNIILKKVKNILYSRNEVEKLIDDNFIKYSKNAEYY